MGRNMMLAIEIVGGVIIAIGAGMLSVPAGLIVAGALIILAVEASA